MLKKIMKKIMDMEGYEKVIILVCTSFSMVVLSLVIKQRF